MNSLPMQRISRMLAGATPIHSALLRAPFRQTQSLSPAPLLSCISAPRLLQNKSTFTDVLRRGFHGSALRLSETQKQQPEPRSETSIVQPDTNVPTKLPMYDMPMSKQIRHLRMVFLVNVFCSTALSLWVRTDDIYTVLAAGAIMMAGFIPLAFVQLLYRDHIKSIRILGHLNKRLVARSRKAEASGESQVEFPVTSDTPLLITKFSLTGRDPETPVYVRDLTPGPSRKYSIQWQCKTPMRTVSFRVSKKIIQYHPDVRALDKLIRENAELRSTGETNRKKAKKHRKASHEQ
ncbi:hypothetical protein GQ54DRAFT_142614 [Martensiomyces pterosporus]|nr:hypothetical protein GQ54DRAFT_142614 [Martensiomyces pterosporus]